MLWAAAKIIKDSTHQEPGVCEVVGIFEASNDPTELPIREGATGFLFSPIRFPIRKGDQNFFAKKWSGHA